MSIIAADPAAPKTPVLRWFVRALELRSTYVLLGSGILLIDLLTGPYLLFPVLFILPVYLSAWYCCTRLAYAMAVLLPFGRFLIAEFVDVPSPLIYNCANALIRVAVLVLIAYLVGRTARQTRELQDRVTSLVTICAWSRTVEYQGEWLSFEEYLKRRFNISTTHGISPTEQQKALGILKKNDRNAEQD